MNDDILVGFDLVTESDEELIADRLQDDEKIEECERIIEVNKWKL